MMIISFAWTTPALLAGRKTVTRRDWSPEYAKRFRAGDLVAAYDRNPRNGGKQVATIRLTADPVLEWTNEAPGEDFEREGFGYLMENAVTLKGASPAEMWRLWALEPELLYVVRFELVPEAG